ncbi:unnamed protein product [Mucor hiemalis]
MNVVAPLPKKPSSNNGRNWFDHYDAQNIDMQDACLELQQILLCSASSSCFDSSNFYITRSGNPLVQDSSFIPLHQAVSQLSVVSPPLNQQQPQQELVTKRPRSYSVGDRRNNYYIIQPTPCKPVY